MHKNSFTTLILSLFFLALSVFPTTVSAATDVSSIIKNLTSRVNTLVEKINATKAQQEKAKQVVPPPAPISTTTPETATSTVLTIPPVTEFSLDLSLGIENSE